MPRETNDPIRTQAVHTIAFTAGGNKTFGLGIGSTARAYLHEGPARSSGGAAVGFQGFNMFIDDTSHRTVVSSTATAESFLTDTGATIP